MALKGLRRVDSSLVDFFCNDVAVKGDWLIFGTGNPVSVVLANSPSGIEMDGRFAYVHKPLNSLEGSGGNTAGALFTDVVNIDVTKYIPNLQKDEVQKGSKVTVVRKGFFVTDKVLGSPKMGDKAYRDGSNVSPVLNANCDQTAVGQFLGQKDDGGFVKVEINLP